MYIGPDDGCHDVPDPIAPIEITLVSLEPTRIPKSSPLITINGPMSMLIPLVSMPGIWPMGLADGLAEGIGVCIWCCGEACGLGEALGVGVRGVFVFGEAVGDAAGFGVGIWCP